jgi:hypothetical protein
LVADLRQAAANNPEYPPVLFFYQGSAYRGISFFEKYWPEGRGIADKAMRFYKAFNVKRGSLSQLLNPQLIGAGMRAALKGHMQGAVEGDASIMPGMFLVEGERILWWHEFEHAGDRPDLEQIPEITRKLARTTA